LLRAQEKVARVIVMESDSSLILRRNRIGIFLKIAIFEYCFCQASASSAVQLSGVLRLVPRRNQPRAGASVHGEFR
jgi:hypothetical protein